MKVLSPMYIKLLKEEDWKNSCWIFKIIEIFSIILEQSMGNILLSKQKSLNSGILIIKKALTLYY